MSLDIQLNGLMNFLTNKSRYPNSSVNRSALKLASRVSTSGYKGKRPLNDVLTLKDFQHLNCRPALGNNVVFTAD